MRERELNIYERNKSEEGEIRIPEGKFESPEKRAIKPLGEIEEFEFFIPASVEEEDGMDLIVKSPDGKEKSCIKYLINYIDEKEDYDVKYIPEIEELKDIFKERGFLDKFEEIIDRYQCEVNVDSQFGLGKYIESRKEESNNHLIRAGEFETGDIKKDFEFIHQQRGGDCILATVLNTISFNEQGHLPFTIKQLREIAIKKRRESGKSSHDIESADSPLEYEDFIYLLLDLTGRNPKQENVVTINGRQEKEKIVEKILDLREKLISSDYQTLAVGTKGHATSIRRFRETGEYALIDPFNRDGARKMSDKEVWQYLLKRCEEEHKDKNFFYII